MYKKIKKSAAILYICCPYRVADIDVGGAPGTTVLHGEDGQGDSQGRPRGELGHRAVCDRRRDHCGRQSRDKGRHVPGVQGGQGGR